MRDDPVSAEEVAHRRFSYAFRGFDPGEVRAYLDRVAEELRASVKTERDLQRRLADAEHRAAHPVIDEEVLTRTLGEETSRILASAHDVARELKSKAEENAARILREAHTEAQRIRASAEVVLAERSEEADVAAEEIRQSARSEVESSVQQARQEAAAIVAEAEVRAAHLVEEAEATSARVMSELGRRRRVAHAQIEQLRAGRERLLEAYRVVRRTLEEVVDELQRSEPEARAAAEAAGRRVGLEPVPGEDTEAPESPVLDVDDPAAVTVAASTALSLASRATPPVGEAEPPAGAEGPGSEPSLEEAALEAPEQVPAGEERYQHRRSALRVLAPAEPGTALPDHEVTAEEEAVSPAPGGAPPRSHPGPEPIEPGPSERARSEPEPSEQGPSEPEPVLDLTQPLGAPNTVSELFARIKAGRASAVTHAHEVLASDDMTGRESEPGPDEGPLSDSDEAFLQRRDAALEGITSGLARRLKRALQDDQNEILDRLRSSRGRLPVELLPSDADHAARYGQAGSALLEEAALAGAEFVSSGAAVKPDIGDLADGLAESLIGPLRRRLQQAMRGEDGEDPAAVAERVGAAYREWKSQRVDRLAGDAAVSAFSRGTAAAAPVATLRWVVDDEGGPCPDCHDNALAGPTPSGQTYPTGQQHPPAHAGCRCLLVPAGP